jgi:hypothetical protein
MLAACGGEPQAGDGPTPPSGGSSQQDGATAPRTQIQVPAGVYDTSRGWEAKPPGEQFVLPRAKALVNFEAGARNTPGRLTALDVANGKTLWRSAPLVQKGEASLRGLSATINGEDYFVVWTSGAVGADAVSKGKTITAIDIFTSKGSGEAVQPTQHLELDGEGVVRNGGGGLIIEQDDDVVTSVDPKSGAMKRYDLDELDPPSGCTNCRDQKKKVLAITAAGPLISAGHLGGFWVPGAWSSSNVVEGIAEDSTPFVALLAENMLILSWYRKGTEYDTWGVWDSVSGKLRATTRCEAPSSTASRRVALSSNGRYAIAGEVIFDLEKGTGDCYEETDADKRVEFGQVTDTGIALGIANPRRGDSTAVQVNITSGDLKESGTETLPFADVAGFGLFWDESSRTVVAYPHAR